MHLNAKQSAEVKAQLAEVRQVAEEAEQAGDIETALRSLVALRDRIVGAAIVLRAVEDEARTTAIRKLEQVQ